MTAIAACDEHLANSIAMIYIIHVILEERRGHLWGSIVQTIFPLSFAIKVGG